MFGVGNIILGNDINRGDQQKEALILLIILKNGLTCNFI